MEQSTHESTKETNTVASVARSHPYFNIGETGVGSVDGTPTVAAEVEQRYGQRDEATTMCVSIVKIVLSFVNDYCKRLCIFIGYQQNNQTNRWGDVVEKMAPYRSVTMPKAF
jgi:hypothetical protein